MSIFTDLFSTKPAEQAAADKTNAINTGLSQANGYYDQAAVPFSNLISSTAGGSAAYGDATGANGAEGLARAGALFRSAPGYQGGLTTGIDAVNRGAAARGDLGGGNTAADTIKFASDYDANKYGNYVSSLAPYLGASQGAAAGYAGVRGNQGSTAYQGNAAIGDAQAQADTAKYGASQNFWSSLLGGASLGLKAFGVGGFAPTGTATGGAAGPITLGGAGGPMPFY